MTTTSPRSLPYNKLREAAQQYKEAGNGIDGLQVIVSHVAGHEVYGYLTGKPEIVAAIEALAVTEHTP